MISQSVEELSQRPEPKIIYGERVVLREMNRADVDLMARWPPFYEPELKWANLELTRPVDREFYFQRGRSGYDRRRYVIIDAGGELVGTIGLRNIDFHSDIGTLGIIIRADRVSRGIGTDAVRALVKFSIEELGLTRVLLDVVETNTRAIRCYERVGFRLIGKHRGPRNVVYLDMEIRPDEPRNGHVGGVEQANHNHLRS